MAMSTFSSRQRKTAAEQERCFMVGSTLESNYLVSLHQLPAGKQLSVECFIRINAPEGKTVIFCMSLSTQDTSLLMQTETSKLQIAIVIRANEAGGMAMTEMEGIKEAGAESEEDTETVIVEAAAQLGIKEDQQIEGVEKETAIVQ